MSELEQKLVDLEMAFGMLQRDYEKQNEVLLANTRLIQQMQLNIKRLTDQVVLLNTNSGGERLLNDEKPPHY